MSGEQWKWADKLSAITPFHVMEVLKRAKDLQAAGADIVRLEVGEPDFPTPPPVLEAGREALRKDLTRYTSALGLPELRVAISDWYWRTYKVKIDPQRVIVTPGTSGAFLLAFGILLNPGDRFAISDPGYPCYPNIIRMFGGVPVSIPVNATDHYQLTPQTLAGELAAGLKGALITSPSNPTGTLITKGVMETVLAAVCQAGGVVISDEIYHGITYGVRAVSALECSDRVIVINGFSKYFAMTGWRLGWMIVPPDAVRPVEVLAQNLFISASTLAQHAALAAFDAEPSLIERIAEYDKKRLFLLQELPPLGFKIGVEPQGAFYIYADVSELLKRLEVESAQKLCGLLLEEAGVALTPGLDFGTYRADQHIRFSYATGFSKIKLGVERIKEWLENFSKR